MEKQKIAIQGNKGSFHHVVVGEYFSEGYTLVICETFDETVNALLNGSADQAVMAIENSIAGSIIPNYTPLQSEAHYDQSVHSLG